MNEKKSNIIHLEKIRIYKYRRVSHKIVKIINNKRIVDEYILIILEQRDEYGVREVIDPMTLFVIRPISGKGLPQPNTQIARANIIVSFFNYAFFKSSRRKYIKVLSDLDFEIGEEYLNSFKTEDIKKETVVEKRRRLLELYKYLIVKGVLENYYYNYDSDCIFKICETGNKEVIEPFSNIYYPKGKVQKKLTDLPTELIIPFIESAMQYTPKIAFGIYCQFFGGLRVGEVVNMTSQKISKKGPFGKYGLIINLNDNNFRADLKTPNASGYVKIKRRQAIYPYKEELLSKLYKTHIEEYVINDKSGAMFWGKNGKPMSEAMYIYYFNKLKNVFILKLTRSEDIYLKNFAIDIQSRKWSTHIGRGVFSNMIAEVAENINEIRQARGDKTFEGSIPYISNTKKMAVALAKNHEEMWVELVKDVETKNSK